VLLTVNLETKGGKLYKPTKIFYKQNDSDTQTPPYSHGRLVKDETKLVRRVGDHAKLDEFGF
jgi:hypothetical protein